MHVIYANVFVFIFFCFTRLNLFLLLLLLLLLLIPLVSLLVFHASFRMFPFFPFLARVLEGDLSSWGVGVGEGRRWSRCYVGGQGVRLRGEAGVRGKGCDGVGFRWGDRR